MDVERGKKYEIANVERDKRKMLKTNYRKQMKKY